MSTAPPTDGQPSAEPLSSSLAWELDPAQHAAVFTDPELDDRGAPSVMCVLAGAGAGKTRVLTRRIARRVMDGSAEAEHTMVLTFTRKAAAELRERLYQLGLERTATVGTFHALAFAQLRRRWLDLGRDAPQILSNPTRIVEAAIENLRMDRAVKPRQLAVEIAWAKSHNLTPGNYEEGVRRFKHRASMSAPQIARVFEAYEAEKRKRRVVDYDDLLTLMIDAMEKDRNFAAAQRWMFRHFFVDEFQDLNSAQFTLLRAWMGDRSDLFVVGDANQAIYGWNGADASFLTEIERHFSKVTTLRLEMNYRSTPQVLRAAASILEGTDAHGPDETISGTPPVVNRYVDETDEANGIARRARKLHGDGYRWADIAILVRTNSQREPLEQALRKYQIPFRSSGGSAWLREPDVRAALDAMRPAASMRLAERAADVVTGDADGSDIESASPSSPALDELRKAMAECLADDKDISVADFLAWIEIASRNDGPNAASHSGLTVSTFHRAKGLEWQVVFLAGIEDGLVPFGGIDAAQVDEERRLFYVAITRSRERVILSWAKERNGADRVPSPWLAPIEQSAVDSADPELTAVSAHEMIERTRSVLLPDSAGSDEARAGLLKWRAARAKLSGVEARLILADSVVESIIDLRPQTTEELAAIEGFGVVRAASIGEQILTAIKVND